MGWRENEAAAPKDAYLERQQLTTPNALPDLPKMRGLKTTTLMLVAIWLASSLIAGHQLIYNALNKSFIELNAYGATETEYMRRAFDQEFRKAEQLAATIALQSNIVAAMDTINETSQVFESLPVAKRIQLLDAHPGMQEVNRYLSRLSDALDMKIMYILDRSGFCVVSSQTAKSCLGMNYKDRGYFQQASTSGSGMQFAVGKTVSEPSFFFSHAIQNEKGFIGVVVVRFYSEEIVRLFASAQGLSLLVDQERVIMAASEPGILMRRVNLNFKTHQLEKDLTLSDEESDEIIQIEPGNFQRETVWWLENRPFLVFSSKLAHHDIYLVRLMSAEKLFQERESSWIIAALAIAVGLMLILFIERSLNYSALRKSHLALLSAANRDLSKTASELYEMANSDSLTGLRNRRYFMQPLEHHLHDCIGKNKQLALISMDIDHFKVINDTYGHPIGDEVIRSLAQISAALVRSGDVVGRLGGEEFAILLPDAKIEDGIAIAERIRQWCQDNSIQAGGSAVRFTCSFGVTVSRPQSTVKTLMNELDEALYRAKHKGRNRVASANDA